MLSRSPQVAKLRDSIRDDLAALERAGLLRRPPGRDLREGGDCVDVSSNDYLALARAPVSRETLDALVAAPAGAGASRLIHGTHAAHRQVERVLASWVEQDTSLLFSSGYAANVGVLSALATRGDLIVSDQLNHASLIDGCRLSRAKVAVVPHRDAGAVARALTQPARRRIVVTEAYFSMDADSPDLRCLRQICDEAGAAFVVDEAHSLGVFGPRGGGLCRAAGVRPDILIGTLGKAVGVQGAFVACSELLASLLWNRARPFVFSTGVSPLVARLIESRVAEAQAAVDRRAHLAALENQLIAQLADTGFELHPARHGPIFPILLGENARAMTAAETLRRQGFLAQAIRPPTVPPQTARLRISLNASLTTEQIDRLAAALQRVAH